MKTRIPLNDLSRQYQEIKKEIDPAINRVVTKGIFTLGQEVNTFEQEFASYIGTRYAIGVGSGTDAIALGLIALGIKPGDEVIIPANAYPSAFAVALTGARIRLVDSGEDGNLDPEKLEKAITKKTKAVMPVHLYGNPADLNKIREAIRGSSRQARTITPFLVEDCAQAHGAGIKLTNSQILKFSNKEILRKVGGIGDIGCFSFYPTKNLGAYGDGGLITTNNLDTVIHLKRLRMYGEVYRYKSIEIAGVSRLDELQAAILRVKLKHLDRWNKRRQQIAKYYLKELENVGDINFINKQIGAQLAHPNSGVLRSPSTNSGAPSAKNSNLSELTAPYQSYSVFHLFVIRTKQRNKLKDYLDRQGIGTGIHYPGPIHLQKSFKDLGYKPGDFPVAEKLSREILSLPMFPQLTDNEVDRVVVTIKKFYGKRKTS